MLYTIARYASLGNENLLIVSLGSAVACFIPLAFILACCYGSLLLHKRDHVLHRDSRRGLDHRDLGPPWWTLVVAAVLSLTIYPIVIYIQIARIRIVSFRDGEYIYTTSDLKLLAATIIAVVTTSAMQAIIVYGKLKWKM